MPEDAKEQSNKERRQQEILSAATEVFRAKGFAATRMDDIADAVGLSKPALYLYFANKEALFKAVILSIAHAEAPEAERLLNADFNSAEARLSAMFDLLYASITPEKVGIMMPLVTQTATLFPDMAEFFRTEVFGKLDDLLLGAIRVGVDNGEFRDTPIADHTELIIGPVLALAQRRAIHGDRPMDFEGFKLAHFEMLIGYLKPGS